MTAPRRLVVFTPGPPQASGGAMYAGELIPALARRMPVRAVSPVPVDWDVPTVHPGDFRLDAGDLVMHFLGNNPGHLFAYRSAMRWPGIVVCHDVLLHHVLRGFAGEEEMADIAEQLGPERAASIRRRWDRGLVGDDEFLLPIVCRPIRRAKAAIVHSRFACFSIQAEVPSLPVFQVPMLAGAIPKDLDAATTVRARLGVPADAFMVGMFGYLGPHKRIAESLAGIALARGQLRSIRLVLAGAPFGIDLDSLLAEHGLTDVTIVAGVLEDRSFFEHMAAVDAVVSLRYPTMGESSAIFSQASSLGKPVIVTDHAQFGEEKVAIRVPPGPGEVEAIADALVALARCGTCRSELGGAARRWAQNHTVDNVADRYAEIILAAAG